MVKRTKELLARNLGAAKPVIFGTSFAQLLMVAIFPVLLLLYTPEDFGVFAVFSSWYGLIVSFITLRYEDTIPIARTLGEAHVVKQLSVLSTLALSMGWWIVLGIIHVATPGGLSPWVLWLVPLGTIAAGYYTVYNGLAIRRKNYRAIGRANITKGWWQVITQVFTPLVYPGPLGLVLARIVERAAGILPLRRQVRITAEELANEDIPSRKAMAWRYIDFPKYSGPAMLVSTAGMQIIPLLLVASYGYIVTGVFAMANRILVTPIQMLAMAISQSYFGDMSEAHRVDPGAFRKQFKETSLILLGISVLMGFTIAVFAIPAFETLFWIMARFTSISIGEWDDLAYYAIALVPMYGTLMVTIPLRNTFLVLEKQRALFLMDALVLVMSVLGILVPYALGYSALTAVVVCSIGQVISGLCLWLVLYRYVRRSWELGAGS